MKTLTSLIAATALGFTIAGTSVGHAFSPADADAAIAKKKGTKSKSSGGKSNVSGLDLGSGR